MQIVSVKECKEEYDKKLEELREFAEILDEMSEYEYAMQFIKDDCEYQINKQGYVDLYDVNDSYREKLSEGILNMVYAYRERKINTPCEYFNNMIKCADCEDCPSNDDCFCELESEISMDYGMYYIMDSLFMDMKDYFDSLKAPVVLDKLSMTEFSDFVDLYGEKSYKVYLSARDIIFEKAEKFEINNAQTFEFDDFFGEDGNAFYAYGNNTVLIHDCELKEEQKLLE